MKERGILILEDGTVYEGVPFGASRSAYGEVVFSTSMTGYQEMLTDPSFAGQIVAPTYPLIGNYGINNTDFESSKIQVNGFVVREQCQAPSHWEKNKTLDNFLSEYGIPGISDIDTRALTRHLRSRGVMMGFITSELTTEEAKNEVRKLPRYGMVDYVKNVTTGKIFNADELITPVSNDQNSSGKSPSTGHVFTGRQSRKTSIAVLDCGTKFNILRILIRLNCDVMVLPCTISAKELLKFKPDGVVLSPGPGDPSMLPYITETVNDLLAEKPIFGICLGHQIIARAAGASTFKLKFGHRGANHPVIDRSNDRVYVTSQNHGYAVDADTLPGNVEISHLNLNDRTIEGLKHRELPILSIQYHPEASPGPRDNEHVFRSFLDMVKGTKKDDQQVKN